MTQRTSEGETDGFKTNDPYPASAISVEEIRAIAKKIICIILGTICIVFIVAGCYFAILLK